MTTLVAFLPNQLTGFAFQPTLDGIAYNANVKWNTFEQRWYLAVSSADGVLAINTPLVESPDNFNIDLVQASSTPTFASTIVYRNSTGMFEINP